MSEPSDLHLPFLPGTDWWCAQGWNGSVSHAGEAAWDYNLGSSEFDLGSPVIAPARGTVVFAGRSKKQNGSNSAYGNVVLIDYGGGYYGRVAHLKGFAAVRGEYVLQGQVVGFCGRTGTTDTQWHSHIHVNTQRMSNPAAKDYTPVYVHYRKGTSNLYGYPEPCNCESNPGDKHYVSRNTTLHDMAYNRNGGSSQIGHREYDMWDLSRARAANPNHPWYNAWNPNDLYRADKTPLNSIIQHLNGGYFWDSAIVYDGLGGARRAYVLHSGFWIRWTNDGGPRSWIGMPVTDEYSQGSGRARQDFQRGYLYYRAGNNPEISFNSYPVCAPGMTSAGWNPQVSYRIADIYASKSDPRTYWGEASQFAYKSGSVWKQRFQSGRVIEVPDTYPMNVTDDGPVLNLDVGKDGEESHTPSLQPVSLQIQPNPAAHDCQISLGLDLPQTVTLAIYNVAGQRVRTLAPSSFLLPGQYEFSWDRKSTDGQPVPAGTYYVRMTSPSSSAHQAITLIR